MFRSINVKDDCMLISCGCEGLLPGKVDDIQFFLLIDISSIHSEKVIQALGDYLVYGYSRKEACIRHNVSLSYFSYSLKRLRKINQTVSFLAPFYINEKSSSVSVVDS
ncbi:transcriptional regulator [Klebsiella variicola]|nr:transcriptional regulator [Klebsiella variicola]